MPSQRVVKSALHNFLGTYTSRYADYDGYWMFGFLVSQLRQHRIDLLGSNRAPERGPWTAATRLAVKTFAEQVAETELPLNNIREACLEIEKLPEVRTNYSNGTPRVGHDVMFGVRAQMDNGRVYEARKIVFVAPHNPRLETRSTRVPTVTQAFFSWLIRRLRGLLRLKA